MPSSSAEELLDKALKRLAEIELEAEALRSLVQTYQNLTTFRSVQTDSDGFQLSLYAGSSRRARKERVAASLDAARSIMLSEGRPMKRGELVRRLTAQGYEVDGADKNKVFGTNLWRSDRFIAVEGKGYWPNDVPLPSLT